MKKILIPEKLDQEAIDHFKKDNGFEFILLDEGTPIDIIKEKIKDCEALIVRSKITVDEALLNAGEKLEVVGRAGVGTDNIDIDFADKKGILVINAPEESLDSVADLTIGLMISACRSLKGAILRTASCNFNRSNLPGIELRNKTLGIIGYGRIGQRVAYRAKGFGLNIIAFDPYISPKVKDKLGVELTTFEDVFKRSDIISIHVPLNKNTFHLIKWEHFQLMKKGIVFINTSRGEVVDSEALKRAIKEGIIKSAGLDVIEDCLEDPDFLKDEKIVVTPHIGASTVDAQKNVSWRILQGIIDVLRGLPPEYPVNFPRLDGDLKDIYAPFRLLSVKIGKLLTNFNLPFDSIVLNYPESLPKNLVNTITRHFLAIFLKPLVSTRISVVNSTLIAQERHIGIIETLRTGKEFENIIAFQIMNNEHKQVEISGRINQDKTIEVIKINDFNLVFKPEGFLFIMEFADKPGMIGKIASFLGEHQLNIAELQVSRGKLKKTQLMVLKTDQNPTDESLSKMKKMENIFLVNYVDFSE